MSNGSTDALTTAEAASLVGKSIKTITRWVDSGRLQPLKKIPGLRGAYLFNRADVEALAQSTPVAAAPVASDRGSLSSAAT